MDRVGAGALLVSLIGDAPAPRLATTSHEKEGGYYPAKRRNTTLTTVKEKGKTKKKQVDDGSGRGRVALENTIVVGRVYIQRMERKGKNRRDAGRPPGEPG